ncbi:sulfotransferase family protein [Loktanella sp. 3ANDIMAR09]|uniref:sulfotransferase family protein n=1 Tax=Loktanella sp. 3ANDIMAR09 TaxID=1225657 RepID=UPI000AD46191|nr:sulfotransferase family protein [Loktanella sp. 3ANDIMAR09]
MTIRKQTRAISKSNQAEIDNILGLFRAGRFDAARDGAESLVKQLPGSTLVWNILGSACHELKQTDRALEAFAKWIAIKPNDPDAHYNMATSLMQAGRYEDALTHLEKSTAIRPDNAYAHYNLGICYRETDQMIPAATHFETAIRLKPDYLPSYTALGQVKKLTLDDPQIKYLQQAVTRSDISLENRTKIHFCLAGAYENADMAAETVSQLKSGNATRRKLIGYRFEDDIRHFDSLRRTADAIMDTEFDPVPIGSMPVPVFIVGMPRSGTTLFEQILASHSQISGGGELPYVANHGNALSTGRKAITPRALAIFRKSYLRAAASHADGKAYVTDKMPSNFRYLPLIAKALPEAVIFHATRDPRAVAWSNFKHNFGFDGLGYSYDLDDILNYHALYRDLMAEWHHRLGGRIHTVNYERLTTDQLQMSEQAIAHIGVPWEDACMRPHETKRRIATASKMQVRKEVYQGSSEKWRKFAPFLDGALDTMPGDWGRDAPTAAPAPRRVSRPSIPDAAPVTTDFASAFADGRYQAAFDIASRQIATGDRTAATYTNAAQALMRLGRIKEARKMAAHALASESENLAALDLMADASGKLGITAHVALYGKMALTVRGADATRTPSVNLPMQTRSPQACSNIIAFSIHGDQARDCEPAVMNAQIAARIYPGWICRFYSDDTVPQNVVNRLRAAGAEVVQVDEAVARWPGSMWHLAAADDPAADRVIFRDAAALLTTREADAVRDWINGDASFHVMRDHATHTDLLPTGLWGLRRGALPRITDLVGHCEQQAKLSHQHFLQHHIWPYAQANLTQHDSVFGFGDARPFPDGVDAATAQVGRAVELSHLSLKTDLPDDTPVVWHITETTADGPVTICRYPAVVKHGTVMDLVPKTYLAQLATGHLAAQVSPITQQAVPQPGPKAKPKAKSAQVTARALDQAKASFMQHYRAGRYAQALAVSNGLIAKGVRNANIYADAAVAALYLERWQDALDHAEQAVALGLDTFGIYDTIAHAHGALRQWDAARAAGHKALTLRDAAVPATAPIKLPLAVPAAQAQTDVIAFSLFGGQSKYCETAVLNCIDQPRIYPGWVCRFYIDDTVPDHVTTRIADAGGEVIHVDDTLLRWPGPMWRFAAYDAPDVRRVIFRDADSVISEREAGAVREWIEGGQAFHAMRDAGTHTELLLAGLWGVRKGALPAMRALVADFLKTPVNSAHYADQEFLRTYVWPYGRQDIMQHDSVFGFMDPRPFPEGPHRDDFHTGYAEGSPVVRISTPQPDGAMVHWQLVDHRSGTPRMICRYPARVENGHVTANIPARHAVLLNSNAVTIFVEKPR